ncbi:MAG: DUF5103 domain-containing protein [Bacteroidales bacterium]|nr:DUF5103 domain-containing protein [Bacteroidales bacterium]
MKNLIGKTLALVFFFSFMISIHGQTVFSDQIFKENIKTVELYPENNRLGEPLIFLNDINSLILKFDELDSDYRVYAYTLIHCDAQWQMSDLSSNEYIDGYIESYIEDYQFSNNTKIPFIHYSLQIPNNYMQIRYSGNYILKVYPEGDDENPILTKKLYVVNPLCTIGGNIIASSNPEIRNTVQEISFKVNISALNSRFPSREIITQVQQNGRYDNQINQLKPLSILDGILDFDLQKENIFPGLNTFRFFDFSSLNYNSEYVYSINKSGNIDEIELLLAKSRANKPFKNEPTQFGKFYVETKNYEDVDTEGEYALVHFMLSSENPIPDGEVYLLGNFDLWSLSQKLNYDYSSQIYHTQVLLKQGYYSYQYAIKKKGKSKVDVATIEGSFFQTPNSYFIRVYYRAPGTTFDQLVGWQEIKNFDD